MIRALRPAIYVFGILVFAGLIYASITFYSSVPLVDGWPVYHRLMQYMNGEIGLLNFILMPHGSHPHSIIYALYLLDFFLGARQYLPYAMSVLAITVTTIFMAWLVQRSITTSAPQWMSALAVAVTLVVVPTLSTEVLSPFQAVLTLSRLTYIVLIAAFVYLFRREMHAFAIGAISLSCIAALFHGSGLIFCVVVIFQAVVLSKSHAIKLTSALPLVSYVVYTRLFLPSGSGEMGGLFSWLSGLSLADLWIFIQSFIAYYAVPISFLISGDTSYLLVFLSALVVILVTGIWSLRAIWRQKLEGDANVTLAFVSAFIALSALSAALAWQSRLEIGASLDPVSSILYSPRYAAVSLLAYALVPISILRFVRPISMGCTAAGLIAFSLASSFAAWSDNARIKDYEHIGAAALLTGADARIESITPLVWPIIEGGNYWGGAITDLTRWLVANNLAFAANVPTLHQNVGIEGITLLREQSRAEMEGAPGLCRLEGSTQDRPGSAGPIAPLVRVTDGVVVGFAARLQNAPPATGITYQGFMWCEQAATGSLAAASGPS